MSIAIGFSAHQQSWWLSFYKRKNPPGSAGFEVYGQEAGLYTHAVGRVRPPGRSGLEQSVMYSPL